MDGKGIVAKDHLASPSASFPNGNSPLLPTVGELLGWGNSRCNSYIHSTEKQQEAKAEDGEWSLGHAESPADQPLLPRVSKQEKTNVLRLFPQLHIVFVPINQAEMQSQFTESDHIFSEFYM